MSRIRSVHPRLFTDEAFLEASMEARVLIIGIWTQCWDDGVFEWKPKSIKASIFPADNINIVGTLSELTRLNFVREFSFGGKQYGLVRNFCRFQRPKKANSSNVLPDEFRTYVGIDKSSSVSVPHHYETGTENASQKGGREEGSKLSSQVVESLGEGVVPYPVRGRQ